MKTKNFKNPIRINGTKIFACAVLFILFASAASAIPKLINLEGKLSDSGGTPLNQDVNFTFQIWNAFSGGTQLWTENHTNVSVSGGLFDVLLGSQTLLDLPFNQDYWLAIKVNDEWMDQRAQIASAGYAYRAQYCETPTGGGQSHNNMQPSLAINYIIALTGIFPSRNFAATSTSTMTESSLGAEPFIGEITMFAGNFAPRGWAFCDGQILAISSNTALFSLLGTTYGGDGRTTFALPDLRGRAPIHSGSGTGPGLTQRNLGQKVGSETVILTVGQIPSHAHS